MRSCPSTFASLFALCDVVTSAVPARQHVHATTKQESALADCITVYWRDIPAQVIVKKGRQTAKRELSLRFTEAIDMCAMRTGAAETDDYLADWRKADPVPVTDDLEAEADKAAAELEAAYDRERLVALVKAGGRENG
jgi:hypothetical protein